MFVAVLQKPQLCLLSVCCCVVGVVVVVVCLLLCVCLLCVACCLFVVVGYFCGCWLLVVGCQLLLLLFKEVGLLGLKVL